jgi:hypothetical protein
MHIKGLHVEIGFLIFNAKEVTGFKPMSTADAHGAQINFCYLTRYLTYVLT